MDGMVSLIPAKYIYTVAGVLFSGLVALATFVVKAVLSKITSQWSESRTLLQELNAEVTLQRTNCLSTIQENGKQQLAVLHDIAESVSYLRGKSDVN